jgi:hypothetical protein
VQIVDFTVGQNFGEGQSLGGSKTTKPAVRDHLAASRDCDRCNPSAVLQIHYTLGYS